MKAWNKGLTKETDSRVARYARTLSERVRRYHPSLSASSELAYILGVLQGDGFISRGKLCLQAKDRDFVEYFDRCVCKVLGRIKPLAISIVKRKKEQKPIYGVQTQSRELVNYCLTEDYRVLAESFPSSFIKGVFDSEGYVYHGSKSKEVSIGSTNLSLLEFIRKLLKRKFNIYSKIYELPVKERVMPDGHLLKPKKRCWTLRIGRNIDIIRFARFIGFSIKRKERKLLKMVNFIEERGFLKYGKPDRKADLEHMYWEEKLSIPQIAKRLGKNTSTIHRWLVHYGIPRRTFSEAKKLSG